MDPTAPVMGMSRNAHNAAQQQKAVLRSQEAQEAREPEPVVSKFTPPEGAKQISLAWFRDAVTVYPDGEPLDTVTNLQLSHPGRPHEKGKWQMWLHQGWLYVWDVGGTRQVMVPASNIKGLEPCP